MARIITSDPRLLQNLPAGTVLVNSKAYGLYIRMKRGTYKKAKLNKAFQQSNSKTTVISQTAKGIHAALNIVCRTFRQKDLWQVNMRRMFNAPETSAHPGKQLNEAGNKRSLSAGKTSKATGS